MRDGQKEILPIVEIRTVTGNPLNLNMIFELMAEESAIGRGERIQVFREGGSLSGSIVQDLCVLPNCLVSLVQSSTDV